MSTPPSLDHIILLLPYPSLANPQPSLAKAFTLTPGGRHADNKTENTLIVFESGVYIELIAFIPPEEDSRRNHWWGGKGAGFVDWAVTSGSVKDVRRLVGGDGLGRGGGDDSGGAEGRGMQVMYEQPRSGGRRRVDGLDVRWEVTFPSPGIERGSVPFWCHDVTPRELRVPVDEAVVRHACGAVGVAGVAIVVREQDLESYGRVYGEILGVKRDGDGDGKVWKFRIPQPRGEGSRETTIVLRSPRDAFEERLLERQSVAITEVVLLVEDDGDGELPTVEEKIGEQGFRISFVRSV